MPALSFSAVEIFPALLSHKKTQTIRPLWRKITPKEHPLGKSMLGDYQIWTIKPRLKVGDIVTLYWKQRSKYKWFCRICGKGTPECILTNCCDADIFPKLPGKVKITEVFEIEMGKQTIADFSWWIKDLRNNEYHQWTPQGYVKSLEPFYKKDGFKSAEDMFNWFDKHYDLSQPKRFAIYCWKWLK